MAKSDNLRMIESSAEKPGPFMRTYRLHASLSIIKMYRCSSCHLQLIFSDISCLSFESKIHFYYFV